MLCPETSGLFLQDFAVPQNAIRPESPAETRAAVAICIQADLGSFRMEVWI
jgi:hypothetical protein